MLTKVRYLLLRMTKAVPSTLVAIIVITAVSMFTQVNVPTVGDHGALPNALPSFGIHQIPLSMEVLQTILPYAIAISFVGLFRIFSNC